MTSRDSSESDETSSKKSQKSKCWLYNCFSNPSLSESELDSDSEYFVINHSLFKLPKMLHNASNDVSLNPVELGSSKDQRAVIIQRGSERRVGGGKESFNKTSQNKKKYSISEKKIQPSSHKSGALDEKIYQYIRMKTYERMNPYEMSPNEFLNNISSVFVDNIKSPVPKDPMNRPRIYNRYRKKKKTQAQLTYEKAKEMEKDRNRQRKQQGAKASSHKHSDVQSLRKPTVNPAVMDDVDKDFPEESLGYKAAIEQEDVGKDYEEKVLIWKILVVNDEDLVSE